MQDVPVTACKCIYIYNISQRLCDILFTEVKCTKNVLHNSVTERAIDISLVFL